MEITQARYTLVRDYLIAQIMIDNANRSGVVAFMTVQEFRCAKMEDDRYVVKVLEHKTVDTHGPAQVVLTVHLYNCLDIFLKELRSKLPCAQMEGKQPLFLSWAGNKLQSSRGGGGAAAPPKILGNSDFLGSKRNLGKASF